MNGDTPGVCKRLFTAAEAATYLGLTRKAIYQLVAAQRLEYIAHGRRRLFDVSALDAWIDAHRQPARLELPAHFRPHEGNTQPGGRP